MRGLGLVCVGLIAAGVAGSGLGAQTSGTLDELLEQARRGSAAVREANQKREAKFRASKAEQQRLLQEARDTRDRLERKSEALEGEFSENEIRITGLEELLRNRLGALGELFGVVRQMAGDTRGMLEGSLVSAQFPGRAEPMATLAQSKKLPKIEGLENLWLTLLQEMTESGKVVRFRAALVVPDGREVQREVVRTGVFNAVADGKYLVYQGGKLVELGRQPAGRHRSAAEDLEAATAGMVATSLDPSRGQILGLLVETPTFRERIDQGGLVGYIIIALFLAGIVLLTTRFLNLTRVGAGMRAQQSSDVADPSNPLGRVLKVYEENKHADTETLELKLDESILRDVPKLEAGLTTIKVLSVIAPLLGLLGTVTGMIETFQQITLFGTGDPKLMAGGISEALVTTMLGLIAAIPLVLLHSILRDRSRSLVQVLEERAAGIIAERAEQEEPAR